MLTPEADAICNQIHSAVRDAQVDRIPIDSLSGVVGGYLEKLNAGLVESLEEESTLLVEGVMDMDDRIAKLEQELANSPIRQIGEQQRRIAELQREVADTKRRMDSICDDCPHPVWNHDLEHGGCRSGRDDFEECCCKGFRAAREQAGE